MNVIILYEHLVREWDAVQKIKSLYERAGDKAAAFSIFFERMKAHKSQRNMFLTLSLSRFLLMGSMKHISQYFLTLTRT